MEKKAYRKLLTDEEYYACLRLGALTKLAQMGLTMAEFEGMVKKAQGAGTAALNALQGFGKLLGWGTQRAEDLAKLVLLAGGITAVPLGVGAHLIGRRVSEQDAEEKEKMEQLKYYQHAAKGLESGLTEPKTETTST